MVIILAVLIGDYILTYIVERLNIRAASPALPDEFKGHYDEARYKTSQEYLKENSSFGLLSSGFFTVLKVVFILVGGFNLVDLWARHFGYGEVATGVIFAGVLAAGLSLLGVPFSAYRTFVIEQKYGFNRTTPATFALDLVKGWILAAVLGGAVFAFVVWIFLVLGPSAWLYGWIAVTLFTLFIVFIGPVVIMPLFNKFVPLPPGELKDKIEAYAASQRFKLKGIFTMDGSKRSTKSNAFFTGFGRFRRIVLFDTLIERHTPDELVSVLAHEIGHYRKRHIIKSLVLSALATGFMFFLLSVFLNNRLLFDAFKMQYLSVYASIIFFAFLYAPISTLLSIFENALSRKYEYQADAYAVTTYRVPESMVTALKKLSVNNLSNLTPHPLKVFLEYTHPPILERIRAIRKIDVKSA